MKLILRVLKEVAITIAVVIILLAVGYFLFKNQYTFLLGDVPNAIKYAGIEPGDYDIQGDLEDQTDPKKVFQNNQLTLKYLEESRRVHTGTPNPFSSSLDDDHETDLPKEKVDIQNRANTGQDAEYAFSGDIKDVDKKDAAKTEQQPS